jgi:hypothetical protein
MFGVVAMKNIHDYTYIIIYKTFIIILMIGRGYIFNCVVFIIYARENM